MPDIIDIPGQPTLTADDYAGKYGISRRTVSRYIKQGKLEAVRRTGRTYVIDQKPAETPIKTEPAKRLDNLASKPGQLAKKPDDYLFKLGQLSVQAKAGHRWQSLSIVLIVAAFIAVPAAVWMYSTWQDTADALAVSQETTTTVTADLDAATTTIEQLRADLFRAMTTTTQLTADATAAKTINQSLRETLADTRQQLTAERKRTDDLEVLLSDLSRVITESSSEPTTDTLQNP